MKFGLLGHPLCHSMSPFIHSELFKLNGIDGQYSLFDVSPQDLSVKTNLLFDLDGFNVTIPYKKEIIKYIDCLDKSAQRYNSVNVVKTGDKKVGYNTDVVGFLKSVENMGSNLCGKVLMLGCGGVAQMMGCETIDAGGTLTIAVRDVNSQKVTNLVQLLHKIDNNAKVDVVDIKKVCGQYDVLLNATSVGMHPNVNQSPVEEQVVANCKYLFDAIYNPKDTLLAKYAHMNNVKFVTGMEMLVRQAAEAQTIWLDVAFDEKDVQTLIDKANFYMENK
ncbi:MAG: shikimate dehydrogenase [Clostridia bacterium]|nr:shikimate dehydrogenase [Clostridia bacterium]MBR2302638.1 shikimate dehydrogenase [Clostridia bacterium]